MLCLSGFELYYRRVPLIQHTKGFHPLTQPLQHDSAGLKN